MNTPDSNNVTTTEATPSISEQVNREVSDLEHAMAALEGDSAPSPQASAESEKQINSEPPAAQPPQPDESDIIVKAIKAKREADKRAKLLEAKEKELAAKEQALKEQDVKNQLFTAADLNKIIDDKQIDINELIRIRLGLDPEPKTAEDRIIELERRLADKEEAEVKAKAEAAKQAEEQLKLDLSAKQKQWFQDQSNKVAAFVEQAGDKYELIKDNNYYSEVVTRAVNWISENRDELEKRGGLTEADEPELIAFFADQVEEDLLTSAKAAQQKLAKIKKLMGINPNNINTGNIDSQSEQLENLDPEWSSAVAAYAGRTEQSPAVKPSKFITNESLVTPTPTTKQFNASGYSTNSKQEEWAMIQELAKLL